MCGSVPALVLSAAPLPAAVPVDLSTTSVEQAVLDECSCYYDGLSYKVRMKTDDSMIKCECQLM